MHLGSNKTNQNSFNKTFSKNSKGLNLNNANCLIQPFTVSKAIHHRYTEPAFTCSKLKLETLKQGVEYVQMASFWCFLF